MYVDSTPVTTRRSSGNPRPRSARREATLPNANANAARLRPVTATARRARLADAIVSQWLLEQVPSDHRHALRTASNLPVQIRRRVTA
jgi:hypothetical protein